MQRTPGDSLFPPTFPDLIDWLLGCLLGGFCGCCLCIVSLESALASLHLVHDRLHRLLSALWDGDAHVLGNVRRSPYADTIHVFPSELSLGWVPRNSLANPLTRIVSEHTLECEPTCLGHNVVERSFGK